MPRKPSSHDPILAPGTLPDFEQMAGTFLHGPMMRAFDEAGQGQKVLTRKDVKELAGLLSRVHERATQPKRRS